MAVTEMPEHACEHLPCHCHSSGEYCSEFCAKVEESSDDRKCGCGHMNCDITSQVGNESTFAATGS
jgi:hypothetical protein